MPQDSTEQPPEQSPQQTSPMAEADPHSLDELMSRDPKLNTRKDRDVIVAEYRRMRGLWEKAKAEGKTRAPKEPKAKVSTSLDDLGL